MSYSSVASRAELCLEAEQRTRLGGWTARALVVHQNTLYSYRIKGESGSSPSSWALDGAGVNVKRPRRDGRFVIALTRTQDYSLTFALNSLHEQALFTKALCTSGGTVNGLYGIILIKKLNEGTTLDDFYQETESITESINSNEPELPLVMPQLSSSMTNMTWKFQRPTKQSPTQETKENPTTPSSNQPLNTQLSQPVFIKTNLNFQNPNTNTNTTATTATRLCNFLRKNNTKSSSNNKEPQTNFRHITFSNVKTGKVLEIKNIFERRPPIKESVQNLNNIKNELIHERTTPETLFTYKIGNSTSMNTHKDEIEKEINHSSIKKYNIDKQIGYDPTKRFSLPDINKAILGGILDVGQSIDADFMQKWVEIMDGNIFIYNIAKNSLSSTSTLNCTCDQLAFAFGLEGTSVSIFATQTSNYLIIKKNFETLIMLKFKTEDSLEKWLNAITEQTSGDEMAYGTTEKNYSLPCLSNTCIWANSKTQLNNLDKKNNLKICKDFENLTNEVNNDDKINDDHKVKNSNFNSIKKKIDFSRISGRYSVSVISDQLNNVPLENNKCHETILTSFLYNSEFSSMKSEKNKTNQIQPTFETCLNDAVDKTTNENKTNANKPIQINKYFNNNNILNTKNQFELNENLNDKFSNIHTHTPILDNNIDDNFKQINSTDENLDSPKSCCQAYRNKSVNRVYNSKNITNKFAFVRNSNKRLSSRLPKNKSYTNNNLIKHKYKKINDGDVQTKVESIENNISTNDHLKSKDKKCLMVQPDIFTFKLVQKDDCISLLSDDLTNKCLLNDELKPDNSLNDKKSKENKINLFYNSYNTNKDCNYEETKFKFEPYASESKIDKNSTAKERLIICDDINNDDNITGSVSAIRKKFENLNTHSRIGNSKKSQHSFRRKKNLLAKHNCEEFRRSNRRKSFRRNVEKSPIIMSKLHSKKKDILLDNVNTTFLGKHQLISKEASLPKMHETLLHQEQLVWNLRSKIESLERSKSYIESPKTKLEHNELDKIKKIYSDNYTVDELVKINMALEEASSKYQALAEKLQEIKQKVESESKDMQKL